MAHRIEYHTRERGNAVTLTLLGLAVAILAGVVVLYFIGRSTPQPIPMPTTESRIVEDVALVEDANPREGWRVYESSTHDVRFEYPSGWAVATGTVLGAPVVTTYDATQQVSTTSDFGVHELDTRVSFYPNGIPTEGMADEKAQSKTIVPVPQASAVDYVLGTGKPWATMVSFEQSPSSWEEWGFVFGCVHVEEEEVAYMRGDTGISPEEFDVLSGDHIERYGFVDAALWETVSEILRSVAFVQTAGNESSEVAGTVEWIRVETPVEGAVVSSPLTVQGEAVGPWYFEGDFPVRLQTADGDVLAEVPATALDDWMVEDFVPFEVSLVFASTSATSGVVVLERDNASGLPENDMLLEIPVFFEQ